ncbi:hypothetical protein C8T65DRAFT_834646 [Cerioporus squamosus]|nr:hypothetical protein C8T65DRAFT_834646 [Cerioporus squamosus]
MCWSSGSDEADPDYHQALMSTCCRLKWPRPWTQKVFTVNPVVDRMRTAIEACGEDPDRVTFEQMESCEVRLICKSCRDGQLSFSVFDWKAATYHGTTNDTTGVVDDETHVTVFERSDADNASRVRELEAALDPRPNPTQIFYGCGHCRSGCMKILALKDHFTRKHDDIDFQSLTFDDDYYLHTDNKPYLHEPIPRSSKEYREFLMSRNAAQLWKAARHQAEPYLLDCPPFLSEPAYANLVFFSHCHSCTTPDVKTVMWEFFARYCQKCKEDMLSDHIEVYFLLDTCERDSRIKIADFLNVVHISLSRGTVPRPFYHSPEFWKFRREVYALPDGVERNAFIKQKAENVTKRKQFATAMQTWEADQEQLRASELEAMKDARMEAVNQRLRDEGYGPMNQITFDELRSLAPVRQARQLTQRGWKSIRGEVVAFMERVRADLLEAGNQ